jgi:hypothetical protein
MNLYAMPSMPQTFAWKRWPNAFSIGAIVLLGAIYFAPPADLDFTWQIRTGEQIFHTGRLRPLESFTYTICGRAVPEFEWLYEVGMWAVWSVLGFGGLKLLKTLLVLTPLLLLGQRLRREGVRWHGIALSVLMAILVLSPAWNLRPLYCTTIGLLLVAGWLHDHCHGRRPLTAWLPLVMLLWANLHAGVIAGQGLLLGAIVWEWANRWLRLNPPLDRAACWRLTLISGLGVTTAMLSPEPLERLLYPFRPEVVHPVQRIFVEMQPLATFLCRPPCVAWLVYLLAMLIGLSLAVRFRSYRLWEIALLLTLAGLANLAVRSLQDWVLLMLAVGVPHLSEMARAWKQQRTSQPASAYPLRRSLVRVVRRADCFCRRMWNSPAFRFQWQWPLAAVGLLAGVSLIPALAWRMPVQTSAEWPVRAVGWAESQGIEGRFFAPPDYGSYLTWRLGSRARCYVDTRGFFFPPELLADSHYLPQLDSQWPARLERVLAHGTDYFLLETTGARGQLWHLLKPHVGPPLYCDDQAVLLSAFQVRRGLSRVQEASARVDSTRHPD